MLSIWILMLRVSVGTALGGVIGFERDRHGRPVGIRTHMLVALASSTFMVVSEQFAYYQPPHMEGLEVDASRIAASVVSGIGFLAGGAILRNGSSIQGLTTAAGLWVVTAIGLCSGAGMFGIAAFATLLGVIALTLVRRFEDKNEQRLHVEVGFTGSGGMTELEQAVRALGGSWSRLEMERRLKPEAATKVSFDVVLPLDVTAAALIARLEGEGVQQVVVRQVV